VHAALLSLGTLNNKAFTPAVGSTCEYKIGLNRYEVSVVVDTAGSAFECLATAGLGTETRTADNRPIEWHVSLRDAKMSDADALLLALSIRATGAAARLATLDLSGASTVLIRSQCMCVWTAEFVLLTHMGVCHPGGRQHDPRRRN
jgi:hypothetical protein